MIGYINPIFIRHTDREPLTTTFTSWSAWWTTEMHYVGEIIPALND